MSPYAFVIVGGLIASVFYLVVILWVLDHRQEIPPPSDWRRQW